MTTETAVTGLEMEAQVKLTHDRAAYMTVSELADLLGVHRNTVHYWIREGEVKAQRIGMARRSPLLIPRAEVDRIRAYLTGKSENEVELY